MAKPNRAERGASPQQASSLPSEFFAPPGTVPNPPRQRPWFLALSVVGVVLWLVFLLWMALAG